MPEDSLAEYRGRYPETPFVNAAADAYTPVPPFERTGYRSQPTPHAAFAAMIARMDRDIGRLMATLSRLGIDKQTLVLFTSDNGPHKEGGADPAFFNSTGGLRGIKRDLYEGGIRVPMIAWAPGACRPAATSAHVWAHWDMLPTLADLAGATAPRASTACRCARRWRAGRRRRTSFCTGSFTNAGSSRPCGWGSGRRCG